VVGGDSCFECNDCCFVVKQHESRLFTHFPVVAPKKQELSLSFNTFTYTSSSNLPVAAAAPREPTGLVAFCTEDASFDVPVV